MKDIIFTVKRQKCEIKIFIACFILTNVLNLISIYIYDTEWSELWTQIFWVLAISCAFYGLSIVLRLLFYGIKYIFKKRK